MANLSPTATSVLTVNGGVSNEFNAGVAITAGMSVYLSASNTWLAAGCTTATLAGGVDPKRVGIAVSNAGVGQRVFVQESGNITMGAILTVGVRYAISATAGLICPDTDLATTNKINILGIATTTSNLDMAYKQAYPAGYSGVAVP